MMSRARTAQPAWAALRVKERCACLAKLRREIAQRCDSISAVIARDTGKPLLDALAGDLLVSLEQIRYYERNAAEILHPRRTGKPLFMLPGTRFETLYEPHGVALICGPSNYPFQLSVIPMVTALAAGNAVILKCSDQAPDTARLIADLCAGAGFPHDLVQVIEGGAKVAEALLDAGPDFVFFTGSSHHGQIVAQRAAQHLIPTLLELGGKDASLVFADCHLDRAVNGIVYGAFANAGRVCVAVKRVYVQDSIFGEFVAKLTARTAELRVGYDPESDLCPLPPSQIHTHDVQVRDAIERGARVLFPSDDWLSDGPVVLSNVPLNALIMAEESFGPALIIAPFHDEHEAVALANASTFALSSSVWTRDTRRARRVAAQLSAGSCAVNDVTRVIANPHVAFGGNRKSGYGRYHGPEGLRAFSRTKTVMFANNRSANQINWFPFTGMTRKRLSQLIRFRHGRNTVLAQLSRVLPLAALAVLLPLMSAGQTRGNTRLTVNVHLTADARGKLAYLVFNSPSGFPGDREKSVRRGFLPIPPNAKEMAFSLDLPAGVYAVTVYEDLNANEGLDHNFIGIPREPVGASNNPRGRFGPPRFSECAFRVSNTTEKITINLVKGI
jgi:acyl-CoA reductase-like NAD-dependent aldehyde dehydrogenase/uncharacterized protein (DUF2141 family)